MPRTSKILATVLLPLPIPPVRPIFSITRKIKNPKFKRARNFGFQIQFLGLFFFRSSRFIQRCRPIHADGAFFNFYIAARTDLDVQGPVFVYFINDTMYAGDCNNFISLTKILNEFFLILGSFGLWTDKK